MSLHLALLFAYSILLILIGTWIGRRVKAAGDFFVGGRRLGAGLIFSTVLAANIGAGSTVGAAGLGYHDGLSAWWWNGSAGIGSLVLAFWIGPRIWREAARHNFYTVGDFLEHRYGRGVRGVVAALLWLATTSLLAAQLIGVGTILNVVTGLPLWVGSLIGAAVMTTYFTAGGLLSSAWVNLVQLVVILAGFAVALPMALESVGGWSGLASAPGLPDGHLNFWNGPASVSHLALLVPAFFISPGLLQKVYGASDERAVRLGVGANALVLLVFAFIPALLGMVARVQYPDLSDQQLALPTILARGLPAGIGSLALAAVFSAEVSTADAVLFMLATSLSQDLYRRFVNPTATDAEVLRVARGAAIAGGALGVGIAIAAPTIIDALRIFYGLLSVSLFVPVVAGLHMRRAGTPEAVASIAAGCATMVAMHLFTDGHGFGLWTPQMVGLVAAAIGFGAVALTRRLGKHNRA